MDYLFSAVTLFEFIFSTILSPIEDIVLSACFHPASLRVVKDKVNPRNRTRLDAVKCLLSNNASFR